MKKFGSAAAIVAMAAIALVPTYGGVAEGQNKQCSKQNPDKCPTVRKGRMTGHGHFDHETYGRVQWEFRNSVCNDDRFPDLKVEWGGNRFILEYYSVPLRCVDFPGVDEEQPNANFDSIIGQGGGTLNGEPAFASFKFTDSGEPGRNDRGSIRIVDLNNNAVVLDFWHRKIAGGGNHQAHRANK